VTMNLAAELYPRRSIPLVSRFEPFA